MREEISLAVLFTGVIITLLSDQKSTQRLVIFHCFRRHPDPGMQRKFSDVKLAFI
ncbi:hypothetical protein IMCC3135_15695 [Granulosicoccus antarcticus IMCC3135]|uniref:Uncharacterized protein n=1 Tax=Granulosicoccus antarcticus IMCC3135 TaxID=1192854 RepID=A0A2Z2NT50_9GAMM|nr:hypothetical protein IMCC3135_15695 [Granulosicoccus antarcticus IMCC3135]